MEDEAGRTGKDRPDGVNKKRLLELNLDVKIPIYHKPHVNSANIQLVPTFPKEALTLFSKAALETSRKAQDRDEKFDLYQVRGGDAASLKMILDWIKDCIDQQSITKFPEILEPEDDPFGPTIKVFQAANLLDIPAGSLQFFLEKRLDFISRKVLMPFSQVREFYQVNSELYQAGLKSVACNSIFNAWWDYRLDASVDPDLMGELSDLRVEFPELDSDLHDACKSKEEEISKRKAEKKLKREVERQALNGESGQDWNFNSDSTAKFGFEDVANGVTTDWEQVQDRNKENTVIGANDMSWDTDEVRNGGAHGSESDDKTQILDWAEESAAEYHLQPHTALPNIATEGWFTS